MSEVVAEILGGRWDIAVMNRATFLFARDDYDPWNYQWEDLAEYEERMDAEVRAKVAEHRRLLSLAAFGNVNENCLDRDGEREPCVAHGPHPHTDRPQSNGPGSCLDCPACVR